METSAVDSVSSLLNLLLPVLLLIATYFIGNVVGKRHYRSIQEREAQTLQVPTMNFRDLPANWIAIQSELVIGNVVVSVDYFKRFMASLRGLIGGRIRSYESLLDRARREAILRMKAVAIARGYNAVINARLEVMDVSAIDMCQRNRIPIIVFDLKRAGNMGDVVLGKSIGTMVDADGEASVPQAIAP